MIISVCRGKDDSNLVLSPISKSKKSKPGATVQPVRVNEVLGAGSAENHAVAGTTRDGTYAEYVIVKASEVNAKPKSIDHDKAAAVPLAGLTAWQGLFTHGQLEQGQKVLIHGASGGVGTYAVQFAKWKGAFVISFVFINTTRLSL